MRYSEMKQAVKLLYDEWNLGKRECGATTDICAWIYLIQVLEESEKIVTYKEKDKLIGFCGYSKNSSKKYFFRKMFYRILRNILYKSKDIRDLKALKEYEKNYTYVPKELENYFDGEISILLVDKNYRGKNIGKKLLLEVFDLAKKDNLKNIQVLTDESCSYGFYEKCGCEKIYETVVENKEYGKLGNVTSEKGFIYEKKFKERCKNEHRNRYR